MHTVSHTNYIAIIAIILLLANIDMFSLMYTITDTYITFTYIHIYLHTQIVAILTDPDQTGSESEATVH